MEDQAVKAASSISQIPGLPTWAQVLLMLLAGGGIGGVSVKGFFTDTEAIQELKEDLEDLQEDVDKVTEEVDSTSKNLILLCEKMGVDCRF